MTYLLLLISIFSFADNARLETAQNVDLKKYVGKWYEIASIPNRFQKDCFATTATYSLLEDGDIKVVNECRKGSFEGKVGGVTGKAWVSDEKDPAKLRVRFFWPFHSAYWILAVGKNYDYALVGEPDRDYLWILYRESKMPDTLYKELTEKIKQLGYDVSKIRITPQP